MAIIHPTAIVDSQAVLEESVRIGPYVVIEGRVQIGARTTVDSHAVIKGATRIGADCRIGPGACIGGDPQHLGYDPKMETWLIIGDQCNIREHAALNRASKPGEENATRIGNRVFIMATGHVGHDCIVGNDVVLAHGAMLGGHVTVGDRVFLGGNAGCHQFSRVGRLAIIHGAIGTTKDIPPFSACTIHGLKGYNAIGCRRSGMSRESIAALRKAFGCFHSHPTRPAVIAAIRAEVPLVPEVVELLEFIEHPSKRGIEPSARFAGHQADGDTED